MGEKIKKVRQLNNLKQTDLANILFVSEKTISSWENNRTIPDLNMIYKISGYFKISFYYLISDNYDLKVTKEFGIKLKVEEKEYNRLLNIISKNNYVKNNVNQIDSYYILNYRKFKNEWLRIRNENGKYIFSYKKKNNNDHYEKYEVLIDNEINLDIILNFLNIKKIGVINKNRVIYLYNEKFQFSFDIVKNIGLFIEIKIINENNNLENNICELINLLKRLNIDLNLIDNKKYIDYL